MIRQLHNDIIALPDDGGIDLVRDDISDLVLAGENIIQYLILKKFIKMTGHHKLILVFK